MSEGPVREAVVVARQGQQTLLQPTDGCAGCGQASGCGLRADKADHAWPLPGGAALAAGQRVRIEAPPGLVLKSALAAYGLPLFFALIGAGLGAFFGDGPALLGVLAGLTLGFLILRCWSQHGGLTSPRIVPISLVTPVRQSRTQVDSSNAKAT